MCIWKHIKWIDNIFSNVAVDIVLKHLTCKVIKFKGVLKYLICDVFVIGKLNLVMVNFLPLPERILFYFLNFSKIFTRNR